MDSFLHIVIKIWTPVAHLSSSPALPRVAWWHRAPSVQNSVRWSPSGRQDASLHDRGEFSDQTNLRKQRRSVRTCRVCNDSFRRAGQDDLLSLKVGSVLHHLSIKRAIQVLRLNNYEPNCLRRRPSDEVHVRWCDRRIRICFTLCWVCDRRYEAVLYDSKWSAFLLC